MDGLIEGRADNAKIIPLPISLAVDNKFSIIVNLFHNIIIKEDLVKCFMHYVQSIVIYRNCSMK